MERFILAIDQGTTSTRAMLFNAHGRSVAVESRQVTQIYPQKGWVEHEPEQMFANVISAAHAVCNTSGTDFKQIAAIGITNQRETTIIWDLATGKAIYPAIVWQDRRTYAHCQQLKAQGYEALIQQKTGLLLDPYFSASKISWILEHVPGSYERASKGELAFGTVDSYLLWRLTNGRMHATDITNAARTLLYNIHTQCWDDELLQIFKIPKKILPAVKSCAADYGNTALNVFPRAIPILGIIGDQHAAMFGQACFTAGMVKSTYGTGCFVMLNTGNQPVASKHKLLTTIGYQIEHEVVYALEGSIFMAGAIIQWLRDALGVIKTAAESEALACSVADNNGVYLVPAFTGMGAPYWEPNAKAAILGLTRDSNRAHIVRAGLEAVCYQSKDLFNAMAKDLKTNKNCKYSFSELRVDGGMSNNSWAMQYLADILDMPVICSGVAETTAQGAAFVAGLNAGIYTSMAQLSRIWQQSKRYLPTISSAQCDLVYLQWQQAVQVVLDASKKD